MEPKMSEIMDKIYADNMISNVNASVHDIISEIVQSGGDIKVHHRMDGDFTKGYMYSWTKPWRPGVKFILDIRMIVAVDQEVDS